VPFRNAGQVAPERGEVNELADVWRVLRSRILTPSVSEVRLSKRGFHVKDPDARELLETVGRTFLAGYARAARARTPGEVTEPLDKIPPRFRGFAYEGAAMGFALVDALSPGGGRRFTSFLAGPGADHVYMAHIGLGWALARLPRFRWPRIELDPTLRWLVLDGYGFHQAYFRTRRYVRDRFQDADFSWPAGGWYASHVLDQGVGRALWFVGGADPDVVVDLIEGFPTRRRADLFSGAALAATYAGGAHEVELYGFWKRAGEFRPQVAQGCAFAAEARRRAGLDVPQTEIAAQVFCGMTAEEAAQVAIKNRPEAAPTSEMPALEVWRQRIVGEFASLGRC
jgi:enediyne biosynthesis protein E3